MIWKFLIAASFAVVSEFALAQRDSTSGNCSPIVTNPKGEVTIRCESAGMSKAQAAKQAEEYAEILNKIRQENLNFRTVIDRLDTLKNDVGEIRKAVAGRHITFEQGKNLRESLKSSGRGDIYIFVPMDGGSEVSEYAMDFVKLEKDLGYGGLETYGYGPFGGMKGLQMKFSSADISSKNIPKFCLEYAAAITKYVDPVKLDYDIKSNVPPGMCWLLVTFKD